MKVCPYCRQGIVIKATVKCNNEKISICEECDTVWNNTDEISDKTGLAFDIYAKSQNIRPLWDELIIDSGDECGS